MRWTLGILILTGGTLFAAPADPLLTRIKSVGTEGAGNQEAQAAWKELIKLGDDALLPTLQAMNGANSTAENWLRNAVNAIVEKSRLTGGKLPADKLEAFALNLKEAPNARRVAYEILTELDPKTPERLLPGMLNDPSNELRRDAVDAALKTAATAADKKEQYTKLFAASREQDQAEKIAKLLKELDAPVNLTAHFGMLTKWSLVGPFDSDKNMGFDKAYEPETKVDLGAKYKDKDGKEITWKSHTTTDTYGNVDLNAAIGKHKYSAAYAYTVVESDNDRAVEFRMSSKVALKLFINGKPLYAHEEYHHGRRFDQYIARGTLKAGANEILLKICQNDQKEQWAQDWSFQIRICDVTGGAVPVKVLQPK